MRLTRGLFIGYLTFIRLVLLAAFAIGWAAR